MKVTVFDQWNDLIVDGLSTPIKAGRRTVREAAPTPHGDSGHAVAHEPLRPRIPRPERRRRRRRSDDEPGLPLVPYNIRYRDGSYPGFNNTDLAGYAGFNEVFPFFNWLVVETDTARYKLTGIHVVYDAGGPVDGTTGGGSFDHRREHREHSIESPTAHCQRPCGFPGPVYCANADCTGLDCGPIRRAAIPAPPAASIPAWVTTKGWQGLLGQNSSGIRQEAIRGRRERRHQGHVVYASTRPFDDPALLLQLSGSPGPERHDQPVPGSTRRTAPRP